LYEYLYGNPLKNIPVKRMLPENPVESKRRAQRIVSKVHNQQLNLKLIHTKAQAGGGSLPERFIPGFGVQVTSSACSADYIKELLRDQITPIIGRVERDAVILDTLCVNNNEINKIIDVLNTMDLIEQDEQE